MSTADALPMDSGHHSYTRFEPAGRRRRRSPPGKLSLMLETWKIAPAMAWGNTVVLKPAEDTPDLSDDPGPAGDRSGHPRRCAERRARLRTQLGRVGTDRESRAIDRITFTGESGTGKAIARAGYRER